MEYPVFFFFYPTLTSRNLSSFRRNRYFSYLKIFPSFSSHSHLLDFTNFCSFFCVTFFGPQSTCKAFLRETCLESIFLGPSVYRAFPNDPPSVLNPPPNFHLVVVLPSVKPCPPPPCDGALEVDRGALRFLNSYTHLSYFPQGLGLYHVRVYNTSSAISPNYTLYGPSC